MAINPRDKICKHILKKLEKASDNEYPVDLIGDTLACLNLNAELDQTVYDTCPNYRVAFNVLKNKYFKVMPDPDVFGERREEVDAHIECFNWIQNYVTNCENKNMA